MAVGPVSVSGTLVKTVKEATIPEQGHHRALGKEPGSLPIPGTVSGSAGTASLWWVSCVLGGWWSPAVICQAALS